MIIYAATSNEGKLRELLQACSETVAQAIDVQPLPGLKGIPPPPEDGGTFEENASMKARYYSEQTEAPVLADDSGLEVSALNGAPGVRSARYAREGASDLENNNLLLVEMQGIADRRAQFVSVVAMAWRGKVIHVARGSVQGEILKAPRGNQGFGYDPLFFYPPYGCAFGEVSAARKFLVSHRGNALRTLFRSLNLKGAELAELER